MIKATMDRVVSGQKLNLRSFDVDSGSVGPVITCTIVDKLQNERNRPLILAHVGETQDVSLLYLTTVHVSSKGEAEPGEQGDLVLAVIVISGSDARVDYGYPEEMLSNEWAGALLTVLD